MLTTPLVPSAGGASSRHGDRRALGVRRARCRGRALLEDRRRAGGSRAGRRCRLRTLLAERTAVVPQVPPYRAGEFYLHELPPLRAVPDDPTGLGLLGVDGYADLNPEGRPGLGAYAHGEFGIPVIGAAKSRFRTAIHAVPVVRGSSMRPLFVTAAGMLCADAGDLVRRMADRYRLPDALRCADSRSRAGGLLGAGVDRPNRSLKRFYGWRAVASARVSDNPAYLRVADMNS
jgi:deoxyribonuclease V